MWLMPWNLAVLLAPSMLLSWVVRGRSLQLLVGWFRVWACCRSGTDGHRNDASAGVIELRPTRNQCLFAVVAATGDVTLLNRKRVDLPSWIGQLSGLNALLLTGMLAPQC